MSPVHGPGAGEPLVNHFRRLFDCDRRATALLVDALRGAERAPERALERLAHTVAASEVWLSRVDRTAPRPDELFPKWGLNESAERAEAVGRAWSERIGSWTDTRLHQPVRYTSTEGAAYESRLHEILTHVVNHATYHRGQIAVDLRAAGFAPPTTDFIAITRQKA
ncbi:MAG: DinB family protein [Phycisphaerales bacterium]|nr:DinB family protein [Phycisphaerales bacterium]